MDSSSTGVKLLGLWSSPFSMRARIGLKMKGVEYEFIEEDLRSKRATSWPIYLLPSDPYDRAVACFWAAYVDDKESHNEQRRSKEKEIHEAIEGLSLLEKTCSPGISNGKKYFGGDKIGFLDIALGS
ncbi:dcarg-1 protein [Genlisea aurea]|uniref:Glutathione S-transferase n=1 Tax=Genlisea aurea TaxID=192259 RepID=S8DDT4_9LAMI|nr:dcarg-1 protein [Genlisea aurea]